MNRQRQRTRRGLGAALRRAPAWPALALAALLPGVAAAQVAFLDPPRGALERASEIDLFANGELGANVDRGNTLNRLNTGVRFVTDGAVNRNFGLGLTTAYTYDDYGFEESAVPSCGPTEACWEVSPWKSIHTVDLAPSASVIFGPEFQLIAWVPMRWSWEPGNRGNSFTGGILAGARLVLGGGRFATTLGVGYQSELDADGRVFPLVAVDWELSERWRFVTEGGPYEGGLFTVLFGPAEQVKLRVSAGWERKRFRLTNANVRHASGIGEQENAPILAGIDIALSHAFRLEFHGGVSAAGRLTLYDSGGVQLSSTKYGPGGRVGGSLEVVF